MPYLFFIGDFFGRHDLRPPSLRWLSESFLSLHSSKFNNERYEWIFTIKKTPSILIVIFPSITLFYKVNEVSIARIMSSVPNDAKYVIFLYASR